MSSIEVQNFDTAETKNVLPDDMGEAAILEFGDMQITRLRKGDLDAEKLTPLFTPDYGQITSSRWWGPIHARCAISESLPGVKFM